MKRFEIMVQLLIVLGSIWIVQMDKDWEPTHYYKSKNQRCVAQLVECLVWDQDVAGSNPVTPTIAQQRLGIGT